MITPERPSAIVTLRRRLLLWLSEWEVDRFLRGTCPPCRVRARTRQGPWGGGSRSVPATAAPGMQRPQPGDVWLLRPSPATIGSPGERPVYVLVLDVAGQGALLVVPFSRYSSPATPAEWRTGLRVPALRVLCLWNRRYAHPPLVDRGWLCTRLPRRFLDRARAMWTLAGENPDKVAPRNRSLGPPLVHPADPRHAYLAEESALIDELLEAAPVSAPVSAPAGTSPGLYREGASRILMAAEPHVRYGTRKRRNRQGRS